MSTDSGHRRKGIARQIVTELFRRAQERGFSRLVVTTDTPWTSAMALYRSRRFQIEDVDDDVPRLGMWLDGDRHPSSNTARSRR